MEENVGIERNAKSLQKAIDDIAKIKNTAVFFIHGNRDWVVKSYHSKRLYDAAKITKRLEIIEKGLHAERLIQQSIEQVAHDTTILIVAHRLSTIAKADQVYVMRQGRVVEEGSFSVLSVKPGGILNVMLAAQLPLEQEKPAEVAGQLL